MSLWSLMGPFVMNTKDEILEAIRDYNNGKMGRLQPKESTETKWEN